MTSATEKTQADPNYVVHQVPHYRQRFSWDCGVSCVLMLLSPQQREHMLRNFTDICQKEGFGQSTWTIDLCYLLKSRYGIRHCMYTTMPGVNEDHKRHGYYDRIIEMDRERVQRRFSTALDAGITIKHESLPAPTLLSHLTTRGPALVLVDAGLLVCDLCKHNKLKAEFRRCFGGGYTGHYVLLVGYNCRSGKLVYRDPALPDRLCAISYPRLRAARQAPGTDEDVILVYKNFR